MLTRCAGQNPHLGIVGEVQGGELSAARLLEPAVAHTAPTLGPPAGLAPGSPARSPACRVPGQGEHSGGRRLSPGTAASPCWTRPTEEQDQHPDWERLAPTPGSYSRDLLCAGSPVSWCSLARFIHILPSSRDPRPLRCSPAGTVIKEGFLARTPRWLYCCCPDSLPVLQWSLGCPPPLLPLLDSGLSQKSVGEESGRLASIPS